MVGTEEKGRGNGSGGEGKECLITFKDLPPPQHTVQVRGGSTFPVLMSPIDSYDVFTAILPRTLHCL